jgi:hypothetical protein
MALAKTEERKNGHDDDDQADEVDDEIHVGCSRNDVAREHVEPLGLRAA